MLATGNSSITHTLIVWAEIGTRDSVIHSIGDASLFQGSCVRKKHSIYFSVNDENKSILNAKITYTGNICNYYWE